MWLTMPGLAINISVNKFDKDKCRWLIFVYIPKWGWCSKDDRWLKFQVRFLVQGQANYIMFNIYRYELLFVKNRVRNPFHKDRKTMAWAVSCSNEKDPRVLFDSKLKASHQRVEYFLLPMQEEEWCAGVSAYVCSQCCRWLEVFYPLPASRKG